MLDDRKADILRAVIETYIETAQPVGSGAVSKRPEVSVSSATIRNEMGALTDEGYLIQPHTSAGRVPTDKGYRFFVDNLGAAPGVPPNVTQVREFFKRAHGELERTLADTSRLLSSVTNLAGVVVSGPADSVPTATVRSAQVIGLGGTAALLVVVLSNGSVAKHPIDHPDATDDARLAAVTAHLGAHAADRRVADLPDRLPPTGDARVDALVEVCRDAIGGHTADDSASDVHLGGTARLAEAFDAVETVRSVLSTLEQQLVVVSLVRSVLERGDHVAIGTELGLDTLSECSIVLAPYEVDGEPAGTIGVLGPTRMDYVQAMATVAVVSQRLGNRLAEG